LNGWSVTAYADMGIDRPSSVAADAPGEGGEKRRKQCQQRCRAGDVEQPLGKLRPAPPQVVAQPQHQHFVAKKVGHLHAQQGQTAQAGNHVEIGIA